MKKGILLFFGAFILLSLLFAPIVTFINNTSVKGISLSDLAPLEDKYQLPGQTVSKTIEQIEHTDLPIGEVEERGIENAWGTVYFIPQNHRYPGTNVADGKNDSAEIAQNQIYDIIKYLHKEKGVDFVMAEGDLYGEVENNKIEDMEEKMQLREEFVVQVNEFKKDTENNSIDPDSEEQFFERADNFLALLDREISLKGAPLRIKANEDDMILYGSENKETREECADIVRNYIYQKDQLQSCQESPLSSSNSNSSIMERLKEMKSLNGLIDLSSYSLLDDYTKLKTNENNTNTNIGLPSNTSLLERLKGFGSGSIAEKLAELKKGLKNKTGGSSPLQSLLKGRSLTNISLDNNIGVLLDRAREQKKENLVGRLEGINSVYQKIKNNQSKANAPSDDPSRADNPYKEVTDTGSLKEMITESEEKIQEVVIDRRNEETAENFKNGMIENNKKTGILQFGAGHEEGLIKELQNQGLSVIVVKPSEVLRRESE